jgi:hypothetical protein
VQSRERAGRLSKRVARALIGVRHAAVAFIGDSRFMHTVRTVTDPLLAIAGLGLVLLAILLSF